MSNEATDSAGTHKQRASQSAIVVWLCGWRYLGLFLCTKEEEKSHHRSPSSSVRSVVSSSWSTVSVPCCAISGGLCGRTEDFQFSVRYYWKPVEFNVALKSTKISLHTAQYCSRYGTRTYVLVLYNTLARCALERRRRRITSARTNQKGKFKIDQLDCKSKNLESSFFELQ